MFLEFFFKIFNINILKLQKNIAAQEDNNEGAISVISNHSIKVNPSLPIIQQLISN